MPVCSPVFRPHFKTRREDAACFIEARDWLKSKIANRGKTSVRFSVAQSTAAFRIQRGHNRLYDLSNLSTEHFCNLKTQRVFADSSTDVDKERDVTASSGMREPMKAHCDASSRGLCHFSFNSANSEKREKHESKFLSVGEFTKSALNFQLIL